MKNLFFLFLLLFTVSCTKSDLDIEVKSQVFQCCNIWEDFVTDSNTSEVAVSDFLNEQNITFTDIEVMGDGVFSLCVTCCQCPAGEEVRFKVNEEDLETVLSLGFEQ